MTRFAWALHALFLLVLAGGRATAQTAGAIVRKAGTVSVLRDDWGVPHIYAARLEDGYYGLGYALAEDRLEAVLRRYLAVRGELASAFGPDSIDLDFRRLRGRHLELARAGFSRLDPQLQKNYAHFVAGIEHYMADHPAEVPAWAPPLEAAMPIAWSHAWLFGVVAGDCAQAGIKLSAELQSAAIPASPLAASNAWVLMPWRTAAGALVHVGDSHSSFTGNGEMFEFRMDAGPLKISGYSGTGTAWAVVGHTPNLAWTTTNSSNDTDDCYVVDVDSANPRRYAYDSGWRDIVTRDFTVQVKGQAPVRRTYEYTEYNGTLSPVVARVGSKAYVVSSPYRDRVGPFDEQMYRQQLARNIDELLVAHRPLEMWATNFMIGDAGGNALYIRTGRIPIRPSGYDWSRPVPGNTSATAWKGIYPIEDLVQLRSPEPGYMQNNNLSPDMMFEGSPLRAERYPPLVYHDRPGRTNLRGIRANDLLSRTYSATLDDVLEIVFDEKWVFTELWQDALRKSVNAWPDTMRARPPVFRRIADRLLHFDGHARKESVAALNYLYWRMALAKGVPPVDTLSDNVEFQRPLPPHHTLAMLRGIDQAIAALEAEHGTTELRYGDVFRAGRGGRSWPLGGGVFFPGNRNVPPIRAMQFGEPDSTGQRWVHTGQRQPQVVMFTTPLESYSGLMFGQSGRPASPHYSDQARLASERRLKPTYFHEKDLLAHAASRRTLDVRAPRR